jgi:hypothetical protein
LLTHRPRNRSKNGRLFVSSFRYHSDCAAGSTLTSITERQRSERFQERSMDEHAAGLGPTSQWSLAQSALVSSCLPGQPTDNPLMRHNIATIMKSSMQKVPHLVVLIKSFVRSDADASVALRDPSGLCVCVRVCVRMCGARRLCVGMFSCSSLQVKSKAPFTAKYSMHTVLKSFCLDLYSCFVKFFLIRSFE